jgi:hypothetical protein
MEGTKLRDSTLYVSRNWHVGVDYNAMSAPSCSNINLLGKGDGEVHPITGHESPEGVEV